MRIVVPLVIEMTDDQVEEYANLAGLDRNDVGKVYAKDVVADVRRYVLTAIQDSPDLGRGSADVTIKER